MVGVLAQKLFGFKGEASPTGDRQSDLLKAQAIGNALLCFMAIPWSLCLVAYTGKAFKPCHLILPLLFQRAQEGSTPSCSSPASHDRFKPILSHRDEEAVSLGMSKPSHVQCLKHNGTLNGVCGFGAGLYLTYPTDRAAALKEYSRLPDSSETSNND